MECAQLLKQHLSLRWFNIYSALERKWRRKKVWRGSHKRILESQLNIWGTSAALIAESGRDDPPHFGSGAVRAEWLEAGVAGCLFLVLRCHVCEAPRQLDI